VLARGTSALADAYKGLGKVEQPASGAY
jgi:hypothetical protein